MSAPLAPPVDGPPELGTVLTPAACAPAVGGLAAALRARGVAAGDRVLLLGENGPGFVVALLALVALDTSVVLADCRQTPAETAVIAGRARARWALLGAGAGVAGRARLAAVLGAGRVLSYDQAPAPVPPAGAGPLAPSDLVLSGAWRERADAAVLWSSGTTGAPKGVVRSGESLVTNTLATAQAMRYRPRDVLVPLLPFSHQYGMSLLLLWWVTGCSLLVAPYRRLADATRAISGHRGTIVDAPPPTYHALLDLLDRRPELRAGLDQVRMWCVGGAPLPPALADRFAATLDAPLLDGYGLSELGNVALATMDNPAGCGRPLPGVRVRVGELPGAPPGLGQVLVDTPARMTGYLDEHGQLVPAPEGWFATGDLGYLDAAGNLRVTGRHAAVHRMGYTLYPESIQRQAAGCGAPVCVVGVDDDRRGARLVLFLADPRRRPAAYWRERLDPLLPPYERPDLVEVLAELPLGGTGKVDRARLTDLARGLVRTRRPVARVRSTPEEGT